MADKPQQQPASETVGDWLLISQVMIDAFAEVTGDPQFIHVDPVAAREVGFAGTIAHGFLALSLLPQLAESAPGALPNGKPGVRMTLNYGCNRLRFLSPIPADARVRGRFKTLSVAQRSAGQALHTIEFTVEIEGSVQPALVAEWLVLACP